MNSILRTPVAPSPAVGRSRVFLVDDHPIIRQGIARIIDAEADMMVCGESEGAGAALTQILKLKPDVVLADLTLRTGNGLELIKNLKAHLPQLRILVVSMHDDLIYAERVLRAGALGYICKNASSEQVLVRQVLRGEMFVSEGVKDRMVNRLVGARHQNVAFPIDTLSDRELEVFRAIGNGLSTRQIAENLCLSIKTIETYREHLKVKLSMENSSALVRHAIQWMRDEPTP